MAPLTTLLLRIRNHLLNALARIEIMEQNRDRWRADCTRAETVIDRIGVMSGKLAGAGRG
jgi:hypothetical protein